MQVVVNRAEVDEAVDDFGDFLENELDEAMRRVGEIQEQARVHLPHEAHQMLFQHVHVRRPPDVVVEREHAGLDHVRVAVVQHHRKVEADDAVDALPSALPDPP